MYIDKKKRIWPKVAAVVSALVVIAAIWFWAFRLESAQIYDEGASALQEVVERGALQCFVVEGAYPSSLEYLQENYGLQINTRDYYVTYDVFASNMPPSVRVVRKNEQQRR